MHLLPNCHSIFRPLRLNSYLALLERSASPYSYLALLERSVLFHALIVFDGLGGDGCGDLAGVGYLGVGSR